MNSDMQVQVIVKYVRSAIDEVMANDSEFLNASSDEKNLRDIIVDKIPYALTYVLENAPEDMLGDDSFSALTSTETSGVTVAAGQMVKVKLPSDVIRVVSARLSSWSQSPVPVSESSQEYLMQQDSYARGSWDRPVIAIAYHGAYRYLELYSAKANNDEIEASVIRKPTIGDTSVDTTNISVPTRLEGAFIYQIAGLTMVAFREQVATTLFKIAREYMGRGGENATEMHEG